MERSSDWFFDHFLLLNAFILDFRIFFFLDWKNFVIDVQFGIVQMGLFELVFFDLIERQIFIVSVVAQFRLHGLSGLRNQFSSFALHLCSSFSVLLVVLNVVVVNGLYWLIGLFKHVVHEHFEINRLGKDFLELLVIAVSFNTLAVLFKDIVRSVKSIVFFFWQFHHLFFVQLVLVLGQYLLKQLFIDWFYLMKSVRVLL